MLLMKDIKFIDLQPGAKIGLRRAVSAGMILYLLYNLLQGLLGFIDMEKLVPYPYTLIIQM